MTKEEYQKKYGIGKNHPQAVDTIPKSYIKQVRLYQALVAADQETIKKYLEGGFNGEDE